MSKKKRTQDPILLSLNPVKVVVKHNQAVLSVNDAVLRFWDKINLAPINGTKDVRYLGIFPETAPKQAQCYEFIDRIRNMWEFLSFGNIEPLLMDDKSPCMIPIPDSQSNDVASFLYAIYKLLPLVSRFL